MNQLSLGRLLAALGLCIGLSGGAAAQGQQLTAICSTDQSWCELAAKEYQAQTGVRVQQVRKATGEALAQIRAEAANPKTDLWWGGTGDPFLPGRRDSACSTPIGPATWTTCTAGRCGSTR